MKKIALFSAAIAVIAAAAGINAIAQNGSTQTGSDATCSVQTLKGSYTYTAQGYIDGKPYASAGFMSFDGVGKVRVLYTRSIEHTQRTTEGPYIVAANCSGSMTLATGTINHFYVGPAGGDFTFVRVTGDSAVSGEAKRVTREPLGNTNPSTQGK